MVSTTPPPPKTGGSGGFIAAAIVMLLLMGGLIYWKLRGSDEPKQATPPTTPPTATQATLEEPPPPPPPPVLEEDAGAKPQKAVVKSKGGGGGGCGGECSGPSPQLQASLRGKAGQARGCYERALRQNNLLQGRMVVGVRIGSQGQVCNASIVQNALGDPGVASCVVQMFRAGTFPAPQGGCAEANVPLNFIPKT
jgi:hypothetical protein